MGQGLHTKMLAVLSHVLGVKPQNIRAMVTATDKVPNTSATAASSGSDLNGQAVKQAGEAIRDRMALVAARMLNLPEIEAPRLLFQDEQIFLPRDPTKRVAFADVAARAHLDQVPLFQSAHYRTPGIHYDRVKGRGHPFHYYAFGACVTEVELSGLTGEHRLVRVDILHDVGDSLVPTIDLGQIEGAYVQGYGWLTAEEVINDAKGRLVTHSPDTYKIPAIGDAPDDFRVHLLERAPQENTIFGSKAVGEPPLMLAISVLGALRHAIGSFAAPGAEVSLGIPATPEAILRAVELARASGSSR
jgi:xanthine dehydrogenase large subunit